MLFPIPLIFVFHLVFLFAGIVFIQAAPEPKKTLSRVLAFWILAQVGLSFSGFYSLEMGPSLRPMLMILPALLLILVLLVTPWGRSYMLGFDQQKLLLLHALRIPVEWCLYSLFVIGWVPEGMTLAGNNYDVFSGIMALTIYIWSQKKPVPQWIYQIFNVIGLILLLNIMLTGIFSVPGPMQQMNFDTPNRAVLEYPFILLPALIVPMVLFSHLAFFLPRQKKIAK